MTRRATRSRAGCASTRLNETLDFTTLSRQLAERVQAIADEEELEDGGHLVLARIREGDGDSLWVALLGSAEGVAIGGSLELLDCTHVDFSALHAAGRVDLAGWRRGDERYLGFLRGRGKGGTWFKRVLGCSDVMVALQETKKLVATLDRFVDTERLAPATRDAVLERAHDYLDTLGEAGAPVVFEELAREVFPEQPERLDALLKAEETRIAPGFVPQPPRHPPAGALQRQRGELEAGVRAQRPALRRGAPTTAPPTPWCCRACRTTSSACWTRKTRAEEGAGGRLRRSAATLRRADPHAPLHRRIRGLRRSLQAPPTRRCFLHERHEARTPAPSNVAVRFL